MLTDTQIHAALHHALEHAPPLPHLGPAQSGKVRDAWPLSGGKRLLVTTDRVFPAFDRVVGTIPYKGQVLNQLSAWWFEQTRSLVQNHLVSVVDPNAMIVRDAVPLPVEVIVRGFITGVTSTSLWTLYQAGVQRPYGLQLPPGLQKDDRLPHPVITPTTKAAPGQHDARLTPEEIVSTGLLPPDLWKKVEAVALALFDRGQAVAEKAGLLLVDTKYEFGLVDGELCLIDEVHTPDSSRYWLKSAWENRAGGPPEHLDKELLRLELKAMGYSGDGPPPSLPDATRAKLASRYIALYEHLTGLPFQPADGDPQQRLANRFQTPLVPILMGSKSDLEHGRKVKESLDKLGVSSELRVASAHKVPATLLGLLEQYEADPRPKVYVAIAGRSNALSGMLCAAVTAPVVSCPPYSDRYGGADVFSSLRMPSGVAPALVLDPDNTALFCAKVLGLFRPQVRHKLAALQAQHRERLLRDDEELQGYAQ